MKHRVLQELTSCFSSFLPLSFSLSLLPFIPQIFMKCTLDDARPGLGASDKAMNKKDKMLALLELTFP